jgi:hypothetical protein
MSHLDNEIKTFEAQKGDLERHHYGKYVVIKDNKVVGVWDSLDSAAREAVRQFGRGPYLIRRIGAPPLTLPASVFTRLLPNAPC